MLNNPNTSLFIIIIYNEKISECVSFQKLQKYKTNIAFYDNSTDDQIRTQNQQFVANSDKIQYYTNCKNIGLSKAYNYVISKNLDYFEWFVTLDQDTYLSDDYLEFVSTSLFKAYLIIPYVYSSHVVLSPTRNEYSLNKGEDITISDIKKNKITAINSGLIISREVFASGLFYDEDLFLDLIDHKFISDYKKSFNTIQIINVELIQDFSSDQFNLQAEKSRFKIFKNDLKVYYQKNILMYYLIYLKRIIKLSLKYKQIFY